MQELCFALKDYGIRADFWSIFFLREHHEEIGFRKGVQEPVYFANDSGALITVWHQGGIGYASTQDLTTAGIRSAFDLAHQWASHFATRSLLKNLQLPFPTHQGRYQSPQDVPAQKAPLDEKLSLLREADHILRSHQDIVDSSASLWSIDSHTNYFNSLGASIEQDIHRIVPSLVATANYDDVTQTRTLGGMRAYCRQGGINALRDIKLEHHAERITKDAVDLAHADNCPSGVMDVVIDPDQMMLQIHESIGHPLELDRILGDERNYAGTSFVTLDMFGHFRYGSPLLNVTFDPSIPEEFASYGFDDEGTRAEKQFLIKDGLLIRPLGGMVAQTRAGMPGVANARSSSWNRPPIDRMANLNLEAGSSSFADMIASIEHGIYLKSNSSWSIDDSRNKSSIRLRMGPND